MVKPTLKEADCDIVGFQWNVPASIFETLEQQKQSLILYRSTGENTLELH